MKDALIKCNRLHCDISAGNIILIRRRINPEKETPNDGNNIGKLRAELIDWELSTRATDQNRTRLTVQ